MREGLDAATPFAGGAGRGAANRSLAHAAEELVRASSGSFLAWEGATLTTHFQPIYCVRREACLGFEALVRAFAPDGSPIASEDFFARAAEDSRALLDWACRALHFRNYATVDPGDRTLFINIHPEAAVRDARRGRDFAELVRYYGLTPKRVCVEILEAPCSDEDLLVEAVRSYRDLGASIAMDDFGVGCSNFDRVARLKPDVVKIDKSILDGALGDEKARRLLPGMIEVLHQFHARVAIEGIESRPAAVAAIEARADYLQGYFFASPHARLTEEIGGTAILDHLLNSPAGPRLAA
jgi:EAL domain-containing protein (putative c-di-GMP-specific phosphodiesterase class I)